MGVIVLYQGPCIEIDGVKYHHHPNGGGLIAETSDVDFESIVELGSIVSGETQIHGKVIIRNNSKVSDASINGTAIIDSSGISSGAIISGSPQILNKSSVFGGGKVSDNALLDKSSVNSGSWVHGNAQLNNTVASEESEAGGNAKLVRSGLHEGARVFDGLFYEVRIVKSISVKTKWL